MWTLLLRPVHDEHGVPDSVLTLTALILLLRPFDVWWVTPFVLAACLSLLSRAVRRAPVTWLLVAVFVAARIVAGAWPSGGPSSSPATGVRATYVAIPQGSAAIP